MSLIKTIRAQLGLSVTPANNFTLDASADNGTMKLARGNAGATTQDVMTVDAAGKVAFPQNAQTWQDVKATPGRVAGTTYTNSTGQPIQVAVSMTSTFANSALVGTVSGLSIAGNQAINAATLSSLTLNIPAGATYSFVMNVGVSTINNWAELR